MCVYSHINTDIHITIPCLFIMYTVYRVNIRPVSVLGVSQRSNLFIELF